MARRSARDVVVRFLSDVNGFLRGTDDVADAYRDMAREADRTTDAGERSARDLARAYERAADKMERDARESARDTRRAYADTGREAGQEFTQNLGEAVSSGDLSGLLGGTAGGLASTFGSSGPIGAAFAALAVAGSVAFGKIRQSAEDAANAANAAFENVLAAATKEERFRTALETLFGDYRSGLKAIDDYARRTGIPLEKIADALAAGGDEARTLAREADKFADATRNARPYAFRAQAARDLADALERIADATDDAARAEDARGRALQTSAKYYATAYGVGTGQGIPYYATGKR